MTKNRRFKLKCGKIFLTAVVCVAMMNVLSGCKSAEGGYEDTTGNNMGITEITESVTSEREGASDGEADGIKNDATKADFTEKDTSSENNSNTEGTSEDKELLDIINNMSLEEKVGQMFIVRCPADGAVDAVKQYMPGGYILFGRDFSGKAYDEVVNNIESYQQASDIPMFIGVDEEGGIVNRISTNTSFRSKPFEAPSVLYEKGGFELIRNDTKEKCELLKSIGINVNFAPVCDVSENPEDFIYKRSFGKDAALTAEYVKNVVMVMKSEGVISVLKHFPGYGNNEDTHTGVAYDKRPYSSFTESDFLPFKAGIDAGADIVLVSHNIVECMDGDSPASLSPKVHEILRNELSFSGVIITDDLVMDGIRKYTGESQAAVMAVLAGNDLLCCTDYETQIPAVIEAVINGEISVDRIDESVMRILKLKKSAGLLE